MIITSKFAGSCKVCGRAVAVGDRVAWTRGERGVSHAACSSEGQVVVQAVEASRATDADVEIPCPDGLSYLGYQRAGIAYALQRRGTLIADEMGLGKTVQAIGFINASPDVKSVLVVCPASLKLNWRNELRRWLTRLANVWVHPVKAGTVRASADVQVDVTNYDILKKLPESDSWDLLVLDEAHYAKNPKSARTKLVQAIARRCKRVIMLTGTPILNKPIELWPLLQIVDPATWDPPGAVKGKWLEAGEGAGFFRFAKRYCDAHQEWHGRTSHWEFGGHSNLQELNEKLRSTCMVRRLKGEVLKELPPKRRQVIAVGNGCNDEEEYGDLGDDYETAHARVKSIPFEEMSLVRHDQACKKVPAAIEHIREAVESSGKVVVFAHHKDVIANLAEGLSDLGAVTLTGNDETADRQAAVERFQTDPNCKVFIGSLKAAGVGFTLTASAHVIFVELSWVPADLTQAEDRCHRIGQTESVLVQHLVLDGSIDAKMAKFITEKQDVADLALDKDTFDVSGREIVEPYEARRAREIAEASLTESEVEAIHARLRFLASRCDGAQELDGAGFNRLDTNFGKSLAQQVRLSVKAALAAKRMLGKYARQLEGM